MSPDWQDIFLPDCEDCDHKMCKSPAGTASLMSLDTRINYHYCPRKVLAEELQTLHAIHKTLDAWRHWKTGNLSAFYPDPSDALGTMILWVDEDVQDYTNRVQETARKRQEGQK